MSTESGCDDSPDIVGPGPFARVILLLIDVYRVTLGPLIGGMCRFQPSCSAYASEAVRRHGARTGTILASRRLLRCHPLGSSGFDPVP